MVVILAACVAPAASPARPPTSTLAPGTQIDVLPASQTHDEVITSEDVAQDNCAGTAQATLPIVRPHDVVVEVRLDSTRSLNPDGSVQISETSDGLPIGPSIAQRHGLSYGATAMQEARLTLSADAHTSVQHTLHQVERWETGQVIVRIDGREAWRDGYRIRKAFEVREAGSKVIPCDANSAIDNMPLVTPETESATTIVTTRPPLIATSTPNAGDVLVETPASTPSSADDAMGIPLETPDPNMPTSAPEPTELAELVTAVPSSDNPINPNPDCPQVNPFGLNDSQLARMQCSADNLVRSRWVVYQQFQRGFMIIFDGPTNDDFRAPNQKRKFYALADDGRVWRVFYNDEQVIQTTSSNPDDWYSSCATAGRGRRPKDSGLPWRGFGRVWCDYPDIRAALGNVRAGSDEEKDVAAFQSYAEGRVFQFRGRTYAVFLDTGGQDATNQTYLTGNWEQINAGAVASASNSDRNSQSQPAPASASVSSPALALGGNRFRISSKAGWQETGIHINLGNNVDIRYVGGQWRISPKSPYTNHEGNAGALYNRNPMPNLRSGVLICRIGAAVVEPRNGGFRSGAAGNLACQMNDDRLEDNDGSLDIQIVVS